MRLLDHDPLDKYRSVHHTEEQGQDSDSSSSSSHSNEPHPASIPDQEQDTSSGKENRIEDLDIETPHGRFDSGHKYQPQTDEERTLVEENDIDPGVVVVSIECNEDVATGRECLNMNCAIHHHQTSEDSNDEGSPCERTERKDADQEEVSGSENTEADAVEHHESEADDLDEGETHRDTHGDEVPGRDSFTHHPARDMKVDDEHQENDFEEGSSNDDSSDDRADNEYPDTPERLMAYVTEEGLISDSDSERNDASSDEENDHDDSDEDDQDSPPRKKQKRVHAPASEPELEEQGHKYATDQEMVDKGNKEEEEDDSGDDGENE